MDGINDTSSDLQTHSLADSELSTGPASVKEPHMSLVTGSLLGEHLGVLVRMQREEGLSKASGEGGDRVCDSYFGSSDLGSVPTDKVVHALLRGES